MSRAAICSARLSRLASMLGSIAGPSGLNLLIDPKNCAARLTVRIAERCGVLKCAAAKETVCRLSERPLRTTSTANLSARRHNDYELSRSRVSNLSTDMGFEVPRGSPLSCPSIPRPLVGCATAQ